MLSTISFQAQTVSWHCILPGSCCLLPILQAAVIIIMSLAIPKHLQWQQEEAASQPSVHLGPRPLTQMRREEALFGKRTPRRLHSDANELQRHWEELGHVSWNITSAGTAPSGSTLPSKGPHQPQICTRAGTAAEASLGTSATLVPAHLGMLPSLLASKKHLHRVKASFNTPRPSAAIYSLLICTISWSCG